jgi:hypothetical protein
MVIYNLIVSPYRCSVNKIHMYILVLEKLALYHYCKIVFHEIRLFASQYNKLIDYTILVTMSLYFFIIQLFSAVLICSCI